MTQLSKMHRTSSVFAAILILFNQVLTVCASLSLPSTYIIPGFIAKTVGIALIAVALSVILFRGKKDMAAGIVIIAALAAPLLSVVYNLLILFLSREWFSYIPVRIASCLLLAAFFGLSAAACLNKSKVSASGARVLLWVLPILCFCLEFWVLQLMNHTQNEQAYTVASALSSLVYLLPEWSGPILMGVSLSITKKETIAK